MARVIICSLCGEEKENMAKGLCNRCYSRLYYYKYQEDILAYQRSYYQLHREGRNAHTRRWCQEHPEKVRIYHHRRWARKSGAPYTLTREEMKAILSVGRCFYCGGPVDGLDHLVPLTAGGGTTRANMVAACVKCNSSKGTKLPEEVLVQLGLPPACNRFLRVPKADPRPLERGKLAGHQTGTCRQV